MIRYRKLISFGFVGLILCLLPLLFSPYFISILIIIMLYSIVSLGLGLLIGYAGQISLGHNAFYGIGAYTSAILSFRYGISPWIALVFGMVLTGSIAYLIGKPVLKFRGHMLVIVTTAIGLIVWGLFGEMDFITGGHDGFSRVPRFSIGGFTLIQDIHYYYLVLVALAILFVVASNIAKSRIGSELRTIDLASGGSEVAAETLGINIGKIKTQVFVISAVYASIGGSLYVHYITHIDPSPYSLWTSFMLVVMVVIGGARSLWGPIIGSAFYIGLKQLIAAAVPMKQSVILAGFESVIFSFVFIIVLVLLPDGLVRLPTILYQRWVRKETDEFAKKTSSGC